MYLQGYPDTLPYYFSLLTLVSLSTGAIVGMNGQLAARALGIAHTCHYPLSRFILIVNLTHCNDTWEERTSMDGLCLTGLRPRL